MSFVSLITLPPGSRFRTESGRVGTFLYGTECGARVKYGEPVKKTITRGREGVDQRTFEVTKEADVTVIAAQTQVTAVA